MSSWYLLIEKEAKPAARNMAIDEYLFNYCHRERAGFFRLYTWDKPSFSYGVSQKIEKAINLDFIQKNNCAFVRRITGGKTVLHHKEITYSVASSEEVFYQNNDLYKSYLLISKILVNSLKQLDLEAYLSKGSPSSLSKSNNPCFSFPTPNEIEINNKKIVGSAQKRDKSALLQHGSIPLTMDYDLYANGANSRATIIKRSMTTIRELSHISPQELINSLTSNFESFIGTKFNRFNFSSQAEKEIAEIEKKYLSSQWNFIL